MSQPHILIVGAFPKPEREIFGGIVTSCKILLESSLPYRAKLILLDSTQISNPPPSFPVRLVLSFRRFMKYLIIVSRKKPDAIVLFTAIGASVVEKGAMAWFARFKGIPAMIFPRGGAIIDGSYKSAFTRFWVKYALHGAPIILCQGSRWHQFAVELLGFSPENAPVIPNWSATPSLLDIGRKRKISDLSQPVKLLFLGWVEREKGILDLIEACGRLKATSRFLLNIVGDGNATNISRNLVKHHNLDNQVFFHGWLKGQALEKAFANADILVLPSWVEGLPNAMIEAMAAKLAVIVTAVGNIPDVVHHDKDALIIPPHDVHSLVHSVQRLINDPLLRSSLADAAFKLAEEKFGVEQAVDRLLSVIEDCIARFSKHARIKSI